MRVGSKSWGRELKLIVELVFILFIIYALVLLGAYFFQRKLIYYPQPLGDAVAARDFVVETGGVVLKGWVVNEEQSNAIIYFGGNAEEVSHNVPVYENLFPNHTIYLVNYRGFGGSSGKPSEAKLYRDALAIYDRIAPDHSSISVIGRSLGSGVATYIAVNRDIEKLVLVTPYDSISQIAKESYPFLPVNWLLRDKFESWRRAPRIKVPVLVLYATADKVVSNARTLNLITHLNPMQRKVVEIDGYNHRTISRSDDYKAELSQFMQQ